MPYARLFVPVVPTLIVVHLQTCKDLARRLVLAPIGARDRRSPRGCSTAGPRGRDVMRDRDALVLRASPVLAGARVVAAVDIGWVSAVHEGPIVDLAGLTDPDIAALPGGHTSKRVSASMLLDRGVDTVVLYTEHDLYAHAVAVRLARDPLFVARFAEVESLPLGDQGAGYVVFKRRVPASLPP